MPIIGNVILDFDFDGIWFRREKGKNIAIVFVAAPEQEVLDTALAKVRRSLDKLAAIYDEGLIATKQGAIVEHVSGPLVRRRNKDGRVFVINSFSEFTTKVLKRHKDVEMLKLLSELTDEGIIGTALGFYNKGLRAINTDPFDSFLSFWSCIITFIRKEIDGRDPRRSDFIKFLTKFNVSKKEAKDLWGKYRSVIAHAGYDPSSLKYISTVASKIPRIKELARRAIMEFLTYRSRLSPL